ncbi:MAG: carboxypeptidase regulatory-like domain-containing protein [Bacteroidia bacterium]|nr:carboxypeptidase regulatory-like domain-containing protein [Bacteroidia bacterium]
MYLGSTLVAHYEKTKSHCWPIIISVFCTYSNQLYRLRTDYEPTTKPSFEIEVGSKIQRTVTGIVTDAQGNPVTDARVSLFDEHIQTDENGFFSFFDADVYAKHAYVTVEKSGFFLGSRSFYPTEGINRVEIQLLNKKRIGTVKSDEGGSLKFEGIDLEMGAGFKTSDGQPYSGTVEVSAKYIDPLGDNLANEMPGSLRGVGEDGESLLATYGMVAVELTDGAGRPLQLAGGNTAELSMPIPPQLRGIAPQTIPLWHFDEDGGYWVEDGEAKKVGDYYIGEVNHFSFWNWDIKIDATEASGRIVLTNGNPLDYAHINMTAPGAGTRRGATCSQGRFHGLMPVNVPVEVEVSSSLYEMEPYTTTITIPESGEISDIVIPNENFPKMVTMTGEILGCSGENVENIRVVMDGDMTLEVHDGKFSVMVIENTSHFFKAILTTDYSRSQRIDVQVASEDLELDPLEFCFGQKEVGYVDDVKVFTATYRANGKVFTINKGFKLHIDENDGVFSLKLGRLADSTVGQAGISIDIKHGYLKHGQDPMIYNYVFQPSTTDYMKMQFDPQAGWSVDMEQDRIRTTIQFAEASPGGKGRIVFSGTYKIWNSQTNEYNIDDVTDGLIDYELNSP